MVEYESDTELRDTEQVPLLEEGGIEAFLRREVLPYAPDAWYCAGSAGTGERALRVSVDAALRAGIFKASGSIDPIGFGDERERGLPRPWSSSR